MIIPKKQLGFALPLAILIVVVLIIAGGAGYYFYKTSVEKVEPLVTEEKIEKEEIKPTSTQIKSNSPYITLLSPNGGEVWEIGKTYEIKWELRNVNTTVKEISIAAINEPVIGEVASSDVVKIASVTGQDVLKGIYKWQMPNDIKLSNRYSIEISIADQDFWKKIWAEVPDSVSFSDFSDGFISIVNKSVQNWKIYRNEKYGFEVKYPEGWQFEGETGAPPSPMFTYRWSDDSYCRFDIVTIFTDYSGEIANLKEKGLKETVYTVDEVTAIRLSEKPTLYKAGDLIYFNKNSNYYRITRWSSGGIHEAECVSIFNQILSTFKFGVEKAIEMLRESFEEAGTAEKIEIYPGAFEIKLPPNLAKEIRSDLSPNTKITVFSSKDSVEKIKNWYESQLTDKGWKKIAEKYKVVVWKKDAIGFGVNLTPDDEEKTTILLVKDELEVWEKFLKILEE